MTDSNYGNIYQNVVTGATRNPVMPNPDAIDAVFAESANRVLRDAVEIARTLIGAHQAAIAIVVQKDWSSVRKFFSLSSKYAEWADYSTPAVGYGIHGWVLEFNKPIRLTQAELEAHPEWKNFGNEAAVHPPMRGWLVVPLVDRAGTNWGLLQLSDKYEGEFTEHDEANALKLADLVGAALEAMWEVRNFQKQEAGSK